ncbi:MAG: carbohydrate ABC transporter permease [Thermomicrobiales bacterium]
MREQALPASIPEVHQRRRWLGRDRVKFLFLLPAVVWILAFTIFPVAYAVRTSLYSFRYGQINEFVGLDNFRRLLDDETLHDDLIWTFQFVISAVAVEMFLGFGLALLFNREIRGRGLLRTFMTLPLFATPVAVGYLGITIYYEQNGPINALITGIGGPQIHWLSDPFWAKVAVILVDIWQWTPFIFLVSLAGLQSLPRDVIEASEVDGASSLQNLRHIIVPMMTPILWLILLLRTIDAFKVFDIVASMTLGGPGRATEVYSRYVYLTARRFSNFGDASAQAFLMLAIVMVLVSLLWGRIRHIYEVQR